MDDYVKAHQDVLLFDEEWRKSNANDPKVVAALLLSQFRQDKKHKRARVVVEEVCKRNLKTDNFYIARRLWPNGKNKLKRADYQAKSEKYQSSIKNLCKIVQRQINDAGYAVTCHPAFTEITKVK